MGIIRGRHVAPGIYTKTTAIRNKFTTVEKVKPINTSNINVGGGDGNVNSKKFYFGYISVDTENSVITELGLEKLKKLTGDDIILLPTIKQYKTNYSEYILNDNTDLLIASEISIDDLQKLIDGGNKYNDIADKHNKCVVLLIPLTTYSKEEFAILDNTFNIKINELFNEINKVKVGGTEYELLCMFNDKFSYSAIGKQKLITPLKLKFK